MTLSAVSLLVVDDLGRRKLPPAADAPTPPSGRAASLRARAAVRRGRPSRRRVRRVPPGSASHLGRSCRGDQGARASSRQAAARHEAPSEVDDRAVSWAESRPTPIEIPIPIRLHTLGNVIYSSSIRNEARGCVHEPCSGRYSASSARGIEKMELHPHGNHDAASRKNFRRTDSPALELRTL